MIEVVRMPDNNKDYSFVVKMALRKSLGLIKGLRRHISNSDEDAGIR